MKRNYKELVKREMVKYDIAAVTILEPGLWVGEYGLVASNFGKWQEAHPKYIYQILRTLQNIHNMPKWENIDGHYYYVPSNHKVINHNDTIFIKLHNGQIFDVTNQHWFNIEDSITLGKELKKGYDYYDPQWFYTDFYDKTGGVGFWEE